MAAFAILVGCGDDSGSEKGAAAATSEDVAACLIPIYRDHEVPPGTTGSAAAAACLGLDPAELQSNPLLIGCIAAATASDPESKIPERLAECERLRRRMEAGGTPTTP